MGEAHRLESEDVRLTVLTRSRGPFLTEARLIVEPPPDAGASAGAREGTSGASTEPPPSGE